MSDLLVAIGYVYGFIVVMAYLIGVIPGGGE